MKRVVRCADDAGQNKINEVEDFCAYFDIVYPADVIEYEGYCVPKWDDQTAVSYFGYDQLRNMVDEIKEESGLHCGISGNGDLYIFR